MGKVAVTQEDKAHRSAILKLIADAISRPCGPGDMIEDRQDALDQLLAEARIATAEACARIAEEEAAANSKARRDRADDALAFEFDGLGAVIATSIRNRLQQGSEKP